MMRVVVEIDIEAEDQGFGEASENIQAIVGDVLEESSLVKRWQIVSMEDFG